MSGYPYNERHYRRFRNILIDLNRDLLTISEYMSEYDDYCELNDLCYFVMALEDRRFLGIVGLIFFLLLEKHLKLFVTKNMVVLAQLICSWFELLPASKT
ncbi:hypothetical protein [Klebsiella quasipneumoniae]|uniref:hypothetical protein n=1 Tax=Klebsiella quasipneumoniae TaxID=1463165 RepID=UPI002963E7B5|nr:hypothetical protein [Klebsiella quasipneumoniae]